MSIAPAQTTSGNTEPAAALSQKIKKYLILCFVNLRVRGEKKDLTQRKVCEEGQEKEVRGQKAEPWSGVERWRKGSIIRLFFPDT